MAFTDWSATPIMNADVPGASFHDLPQTQGVWAVGIRQIMADLVTASAGWGGSGGSGTVTSVSAGYGMTFATINVSGSVAVDPTVIATISTAQVLTNKTISGAANTFSNVPISALTGGPLTVPFGGIGVATLAAGYAKANGTSAFTAVATIPVADISGALTVAARLTSSGTVPGTGTLDLAASGVTPGTYGSSTTIPVPVVDTYGRITSISTVGVSGAAGGTVSLITSTGGTIAVTSPAGPTANVDLVIPVATASGGTAQITPLHVTNIAAMVALVKADLVDKQIVQVAGYYTSGDRGGGLFVWDAASTETTNVGTCFQAAAGGVGRWLRLWETVLNVKMFGAKGDDVTDDTSAIQAAIDYTNDSQYTALFFPATPYSSYRISTITTPSTFQGRFTFYGETSSVLKANTPNVSMIVLGHDPSRLNGHIMHSLEIDGNDLAGVTCLEVGDTTDAFLRLFADDLLLKRGYCGMRLGNVQETRFTNVVFQYNTVGTIIETDPTLGGATTLLWNGCIWQGNEVGLFAITRAVIGAGGWQFNQPLFQSNTVSAVALFGNGAGGGGISLIQFNVMHLEDNATVGASITVEGETVEVNDVQTTGIRFAVNSSLLPATGANPVFRLRNDSRLAVRDCDVVANAVHFDCDATSQVYLEGANLVGGSGNGIADWAGFTMQVNENGGIYTGVPIIAPSSFPTNYYAGTGLNADAPEADNITAGATATKVFDTQHGMVQQVAYSASAGTPASNSIGMKPITASVAVGSSLVVTMLMKATAATTMTLYGSGTGTFVFSDTIALTTEWQRIVMYGPVSTASATGYILFVYPTGTDGPTIQMAKMMTAYSAAGDNNVAVNNVIRLGQYNNTRVPMYGTSAPTGGTFAVGARVINVVPTAGQPKAWSCTVAGTPGTWVSEGNL